MKYFQSEKSRELQPCELQRKLGREQERHGGEQQVGLPQLQPLRGDAQEEGLAHPGQDQLRQAEEPDGAGQLHCCSENWNSGNEYLGSVTAMLRTKLQSTGESSQLKIDSNKDFNRPLVI